MPICLRTFTLLAALLAAACSDGTDLAPAAGEVSVANLNVLHGFDCDPPLPADGDQCRVGERVALLAEHLRSRGCPDIVTLQEIVNSDYVQRSPTERVGPLQSLVELIEAELPGLAGTCGFEYELLYQPFLPQAVAETDEEMILSRYPILQWELRVLHSALYDIAGGFQIFARHVLYARVDHPAGPVDVYTTHLASGSDAATNDCASFRELLPGTGIGPRLDCPPECDARDTVRACQAEQLALFVEQTRDPGRLAVITGDFNAIPGSAEYLSMTNRGWLDTHREAGSPECDASTGEGCTSGRASSAAALESPELGTRRRIDYIFAAQPAATPGCRVLEAGLFAHRPNPFATGCGAPPDPICWVSDHSGNHARLACRP